MAARTADGPAIDEITRPSASPTAVGTPVSRYWHTLLGVPEVGGPLALVETGDSIKVDVVACTKLMNVASAKRQARQLRDWLVESDVGFDPQANNLLRPDVVVLSTTGPWLSPDLSRAG